jgi:hypothetical protein
MKKKLTKIFSFNMIGSLLNFFTTILVVKFFGLTVFGAFVIVSAYIGIFTLVYIIIPPSYAVFKMQDEKDFNNILFLNYIVGSIVIVVFAYLFNTAQFFSIDINLFILFVITNGLLNYFDVFFKAKNLLDRYYILLLITYITRFLLIILFDYLNLASLENLVLISIISYSIAFFYGLLSIKNEIKVISIYQYVRYIKDNIKQIKHYYVNIILKRLKDNATIIIFGQIVSTEIIAIYSLFTKVSGFVLGQLRVIEAFFMSRENLKNISVLEKKRYLISFLAQMMILSVGLIYLKLSTGSFYFNILLLYSFIAYPYVILIIIRNKLLSNYDVSILSKMYLLYLLLLVIFYMIDQIIHINLINLIEAILIMEIANIFFLKITLKVKN